VEYKNSTSVHKNVADFLYLQQTPLTTSRMHIRAWAKVKYANINTNEFAWCMDWARSFLANFTNEENLLFLLIAYSMLLTKAGKQFKGLPILKR